MDRWTGVDRQTGVDRWTGVRTWWAVLIRGDAVAQSQRLPLLLSELGGATGALLLLAAQGRWVLLWGWTQRGPPLHLQRLELQQGTLQAEAEHARHTDPEINPVPGGGCWWTFDIENVQVVGCCMKGSQGLKDSRY